jgi:hypothetical protein
MYFNESLTRFKYGTDINVKNNFGRTPLIESTWYFFFENHEIIELDSTTGYEPFRFKHEVNV